jgi:hypothetical protein
MVYQITQLESGLRDIENNIFLNLKAGLKILFLPGLEPGTFGS